MVAQFLRRWRIAYSAPARTRGSREMAILSMAVAAVLSGFAANPVSALAGTHWATSVTPVPQEVHFTASSSDAPCVPIALHSLVIPVMIPKGDLGIAVDSNGKIAPARPQSLDSQDPLGGTTSGGVGLSKRNPLYESPISVDITADVSFTNPEGEGGGTSYQDSRPIPVSVSLVTFDGGSAGPPHLLGTAVLTPTNYGQSLKTHFVPMGSAQSELLRARTTARKSSGENELVIKLSPGAVSPYPRGNIDECVTPVSATIRLHNPRPIVFVHGFHAGFQNAMAVLVSQFQGTAHSPIPEADAHLIMDVEDTKDPDIKSPQILASSETRDGKSEWITSALP